MLAYATFRHFLMNGPSNVCPEKNVGELSPPLYPMLDEENMCDAISQRIFI